MVVILLAMGLETLERQQFTTYNRIFNNNSRQYLICCAVLPNNLPTVIASATPTDVGFFMHSKCSFLILSKAMNENEQSYKANLQVQLNSEGALFVSASSSLLVEVCPSPMHENTVTLLSGDPPFVGPS